MKSYTWIGLVFLVVLPVQSAESPLNGTQIWIVDNNLANNAAHFQSVQEAVNAASPGDTILLTPSLESYGRATIDRSITLIGPGFGGQELVGPFQATPATVGYVEIRGGVSNVAIMGVTFSASTGIGFTGARQIQSSNPDGSGTVTITEPGSDLTTNILIYRNHFVGEDNLKLYSGYGSSHMKNLFVINNYMKGDIVFGGDGYIMQWTAQCFVLNNRITGRIQMTTAGSGNYKGESSDVAIDAVIENNLITGWVELGSGRFRNNIYDQNSIHNSGSIVENNIFVGEWPEQNDEYWGPKEPSPSREKNRLANTMGDVMQWGSGVPWWENWVLTENSPAKGYGTDGTDAGIFGGFQPWDTEQMPPIPYIKEFRAPALVNQGQPVKVEVEVRVND